MARSNLSQTRVVDAGLWMLSAAIVAAILVFSWAAEPPLSTFSYTDKVGHALAYAALTGTMLLAAVWRPLRGAGRFPGATLAILAASVVLGGIAELGQGLFFHRDASFRDLAIDAAGVVAAYVVWLALRRRLTA
jgi:VanZ family protein